ncbi:alpha/beta hydrolase [Allorhizobium sp. BGMRC 0089]|uniref:alpha/beta hydrolase n=1 Tax=Allorhizobium sonneratiae TaxID=2934936 RepID=UPI002033A8CC|nr:alpha/beta hydrolase [Allorhizobium sonneratiae]MCM2293892.1 alpha/beta hydrolase [Allorhizobium sonneratiae]
MQTVSYKDSAGALLQADLFLPEGAGPFPLIIGVSGGGWVRGNRAALKDWGRFLAAAGFAFASIDYRRALKGQPAFPGNVEDVASGLQYFHEHGAEHGINPERIAILGVSAGAHLGALASLSAEWTAKPPRAFAGIYGVYDLMAHWQADLAVNSVTDPDKTEWVLGADPFDNPLLYHQASPLRQITYARTMPVFLCWGHLDRDVSPQQSAGFATALRQAGYPVSLQELPDAGHLWFSQEGPQDPGSHSARVAPALLRFFRQSLLTA